MDWIFDAHSFVTRVHCGAWTDWLIRINQVANFFIFIAYMTIPLSILSLWLKVKNNSTLDKTIKQNSWMMLMFVIFIVSCGLTHLMDVLAFTWAPYRLFTLVDIVTATASVPTAFLLPVVIRQVFQAGIDEGEKNNQG